MSSALAHNPARLPKALRGFSHINRYWDPVNHTFAAKILPGEYYITTEGEMITTVLGSCIAACIRDPNTGIGGMNHFMLPDYVDGGCTEWGITGENAGARYGRFAMELLISSLVKLGARKSDLEIKLFGGGRVLKLNFDIAARNIEFIGEYMTSIGLPVRAEDLGGVCPRKVNYYPSTGSAWVRKLTIKNRTIVEREEQYLDFLHHIPLDKENEYPESD